MLETALVSTTGLVRLGDGGASSGGTSNPTSSSTTTEDSWDCDDPGKFIPIKLECPDSFDTMMLSQTSGDFAELKPLPFDYGSGGMDPILSENNNCSSSKDLNLRSPSRFYSDVTSSNTTPPPSQSSSPGGVTTTTASSSTSSSPINNNTSIKLELDFTASQDAFDDLASIVGISMGADSTVPNLDSSDVAQEWSDLDAWIENTAQDIKPLEGSTESLMNATTILRPITHTSSQQPQQPYIINSGSTLHSLLTGPSKITQLQQREVGTLLSIQHQTLLPPPPYSILQNRLQHGAASGKSSSESTSSSFYGDSMPHSTSVVGNSSSEDLRRNPSLNEIKAKKSSSSKIHGARHKLNGVSSSPNHSSSSSLPGDNSKKMMHHCHICNRGFLNKSNIKVHLRTHTGEKPFKCEHCSKAFRQKAHLLKHMSIHKRISRD